MVWSRFGNVPNLVDPFFGSGAVLLGRPHPPQLETVNDLDGHICNFFRAIQHDPEQTAHHADAPVNECDLHAKHIYLVNHRADLTAKLEGDPEHFDAKIAGWWVWGICCWIGSGWCSGNGPWQSVDGKMTKVESGGVWRQRPEGGAGKGVNRQPIGIHAWFDALSARLRRVRVCCGDWSRVMGPTVTLKNGVTGILLDPPYSTEAGRDMGLYAKDCGKVAHEVRRWAIENGDNPLLRIALCGYEGEGEPMPDSWECVAWKPGGGYASQGRTETAGKANRARERVWFSRACLKAHQTKLDI